MTKDKEQRMETFRQYLEKRAEDDDPIGDVAREALWDKKAPEEYEALRMHLIKHSVVSGTVVPLLDRAHGDYQDQLEQ